LVSTAVNEEKVVSAGLLFPGKSYYLIIVIFCEIGLPAPRRINK
jgi:hypothetical protein